MTLDAWTTDRLLYLKALKSRTDQQELLIYLAQKTQTTPQDNRKLAMLIKAEKAGVKAAQARQQIAILLAAEKRSASQAERKARNHRLIQQGVLFNLAGLANRSRGELLGVLMAAASTEDVQRWSAWKARGDALLSTIESPANQLPSDVRMTSDLPHDQVSAGATRDAQLSVSSATSGV